MPISRYYDVKRDEKGERYLEPYVTGFLLLRLPLLNKGTAFTEAERVGPYRVLRRSAVSTR